jgi:hypothetical protein
MRAKLTSSAFSLTDFTGAPHILAPSVELKGSDQDLPGYGSQASKTLVGAGTGSGSIWRSCSLSR